MRPLILCMFLFYITGVEAQERLGLTTGAYAGVNASWINPAAFQSSPLLWDAQLIGVGIFADQNHMYFENTRLIDILSPGFQGVNGDYIEGIALNGRTPFYFYPHTDDRHVYANVIAMGPAFQMKYEKYSLGVSFSYRVAASARNIAPHLPYPQITREPENTWINVPEFQVAALGWSELKLNPTMALDESTTRNINIGGSLKFLAGKEALFLNVEKEGRFRRYGDTVETENAHIKYGYTDNRNQNFEYQLQTAGRGMALDLGFEQVRYKSDRYHSKFGASLVDLGYISFKENAAEFEIAQDDLRIVYTPPYTNLSGIPAFDPRASTDAYGNASTSYLDGSYKVFLPTAVVLNGDIGLGGGLYAQGLLVQRIPLHKNSVRRENMVYAGLRFENRVFGIYASGNLYEYESLKAGAAFRLYYLTVGSEDLLSILKPGNFDGTDFYLSLKVNDLLTKKSKKLKNNKLPKDPLSCPKKVSW